MRVDRVTLYRMVILPAAAPRILAGLRVALGIGLILMVLSELFATTRGIGYEIALSQQSFRYSQMWAALLVVSIIGVLLNMVFDRVERRILRWNRRST